MQLGAPVSGSSGIFDFEYRANDQVPQAGGDIDAKLGHVTKSLGSTVSASSNVLTPGEVFTVTETNGHVHTYTYTGTVSVDGQVIGFAATAIDPHSGLPHTYVFTDTGQPASGPIVIDPSQDFTICFMAGTAITTPCGPVAVEALTAGDIVCTADGGVAPVRWIGRQTVSTVFADPLRVLPIRIRAGALADAVPVRDLLVSPDHAILVDGVLVQASALVNGTSIRRETAVPKIFVYYHVELASHALLLAEGVPAETFIDNAQRAAFDNWEEHQALGVEAASIPEMEYPRAKAHRQVPQETRQRLSARAASLFAEVIDAAA